MEARERAIGLRVHRFGRRSGRGRDARYRGRILDQSNGGQYGLRVNTSYLHGVAEDLHLDEPKSERMRHLIMRDSAELGRSSLPEVRKLTAPHPHGSQDDGTARHLDEPEHHHQPARGCPEELETIWQISETTGLAESFG